MSRLEQIQERRSRLSAAQMAVLRQRLRGQLGRLGEAGERLSIPRRATSGPCPVSFAQERLWFYDQWEPGSAADVQHAALRLRGPIDRQALARCLIEIVARHEVLRTVVQQIDGELLQMIEPTSAEVPFRFIDLSQLAEGAREREAQRLAVWEARRPFDLAVGPLWRQTLIRLVPDEHLLLMTQHHLVYDGWSLGVLMPELAVLYQHFKRPASAHLPLPLPPLAIQYADYAAWQRQTLPLESLLDFWRERLEAGLPVLELPTDRQRPARQTFRGQTLWVHWPKARVDRWRKFAQQHGATLYAVLAAGLASLLQRYSGQSRFGIGSPVANRQRSEVEALIGCFINTLVLRVDLKRQESFGDRVEQFQKEMSSAYAHQELPFEKLIEALQPERSLSHSPFFQVLLNLNPQMPEVEVDGLDIDFVEVDNRTTVADLALYFDESATGLDGKITFRSDLFDRSTIARLLRHYGAFLDQAVHSLELHASAVPILDVAERHQLLVEWNDHQHSFELEPLLPSLFERQVARRLDAVALVQESTDGSYASVSYRELERRANRLAWKLRSVGVGPEIPVGLALERSAELIVGLWSILKAGGAFVALDPDFPRERLALMLGDSGARWMLSQCHLAEKLPLLDEVETLFLDPDAAFWPGEDPGPPPRSGLDPDHLAYTIFTSGSTGRPKGSMNSHAAICNRVLGAIREYGLDERVGVLQKTASSFDISLWEFFVPMACGGRLMLPRPGGHRDTAHLTRLLIEHRLSDVFFVPSRLAVWLEQEEIAECHALERVVAGGEWVSSTVAHRFAERFGQEDSPKLIDRYGPTEVTLWATGHVYRGDEIGAGVPIGRPLTNVSAYVVDRDLRPVPPGVAGELLLGGPQLARGYRRREPATALAFIPHPFAEERGARLYRTGDLVRFLADGELEFLGRIDHQVKVRGYRIELGEIETRLRSLASVQQAAVVVRESAEDRSLVAFLVLNSGPETHLAELREALLEHLPSYMIPARFETLDVLPSTPNGKVDRKALIRLAGELDAPKASAVYAAPRNDTEAKLVKIWQELLGVERVGIDDDFFALGGHSLIATRLIQSLNQDLDVEVPLTRLFETSTPRQLAAEVERLKSGGTDDETPILNLKREAELDPSIRPPEPAPDSFASPRFVLLTGATGFVGAHLLYELLSRTEAEIHCLVRADSLAVAGLRLRQTLEGYGLWQSGWGKRLAALPGDLSAPDLGLSKARFNVLSRRVDAIYHCGAWVNFTYPFSALRPANVGGTAALLRLAAQHRAKPLHLMSTITVLPEQRSSDGKPWPEQPLTEPHELLVNGYEESKWVADAMGSIAASRGLPVRLYRLGLVGGHARNGVTHDKDLIWSLIKACVQVGAAPRVEAHLNMIPVDRAAAEIAALSLAPSSPRQPIYHLLDERSAFWNEIVGWLRSFGYPLQEWPLDAWLQKLRETPEHALSAFLPLLSGAAFDQMLGSERREELFATEKTRAEIDRLADPTLATTAFNEERFHASLAFLGERGFLPLPSLDR